MSDERWTPHQRIGDRQPTPGEHLWTLIKGTETRRAELRNACELQIYANDQFVSGKRYASRGIAIAEADAAREALMAAGFTKGGA